MRNKYKIFKVCVLDAPCNIYCMHLWANNYLFRHRRSSPVKLRNRAKQRGKYNRYNSPRHSSSVHFLFHNTLDSTGEQPAWMKIRMEIKMRIAVWFPHFPGPSSPSCLSAVFRYTGVGCSFECITNLNRCKYKTKPRAWSSNPSQACFQACARFRVAPSLDFPMPRINWYANAARGGIRVNRASLFKRPILRGGCCVIFSH